MTSATLAVSEEPASDLDNGYWDSGFGDSDDAEGEDDSVLPQCVHGSKCYRKNPEHFKE